MYLVQRLVSAMIGISILILGYRFQSDIPTIGATGEAVNIGGNLYPTSLVLWFFWLVTISISGLYLLFALKVVNKQK